jgi:hypothetical protein
MAQAGKLYRHSAGYVDTIIFLRECLYDEVYVAALCVGVWKVVGSEHEMGWFVS